MGMLKVGERKTPTQPLQRVKSKHRDIMRRLIAGESQREIANDIGMTEGRLSIIVNSPLFASELEKMEEQVAEQLIKNASNLRIRYAEHAEEALDVQLDIMRDEMASASVRADVAGQIQDRAGYSRKGEKQGPQTVVVVSNINRGEDGQAEQVVEVEVDGEEVDAT